ncbi:hypothetical protein G9A89_003241 [Geosiphon pyriformis]|nr:hypothetical protein G9A89_003241 [Geosiphon pyriformis]
MPDESTKERLEIEAEIEPSFLKSLKMETNLSNQLLKTKPLHRAIQTAALEAQIISNCETHKDKQNNSEHISQVETWVFINQAQPSASNGQEKT